MRAIVIKKHKGEEAVKIEQSFSDVPALYEFLLQHGVYINFKEAAEDLTLPEVVYTVPLLTTSGLSYEQH